MGVLSDVLAYKQQKDAQAQADLQSIPLGIAAFTQAKQVAQKNMLDNLIYQTKLAKAPYELQKLQSEASLIPGKKAKLEADTNKSNAEAQVLNQFLGGGGEGDIQATEANIGGVKLENTKMAEAAATSKAEREIQTDVRKDALKRFSKIDELLPLMDQFEEQLNAVPVKKGVVGKAQGVWKAIEGQSGADPFAASNLKQIDATRALAARAFGEVGNLSKPEQENAKGFFSQITDPADTRVVNTLSGLNLLKKKMIQTAEKSGLKDDPIFVNKLNLINERIDQKRQQAIDMGIDQKKLAKFLGEEVSDLPAGVTEEKVAYTMKKHNLTREQVLGRINARSK